MDEYLLGIDNGGTVTKVVLFDLEGRDIQVASRKVNPSYPHPGWTERSMTQVWESTSASIREMIEQGGIHPNQIRAVGTTGHGNGMYLLDQTMQPLRSAVLSVDSRADAIVQDIVATRFDELWSFTLQQLWAAQPPTLLAWLKLNEPDTYQRIGAFLLCKDYIRFCLTGVISTDPSDMSATSMLASEQFDYHDDLLAIYDIQDIREKLPPLRGSTDIVGRVTNEAARVTGLAVGTPVVSGMLDICAVALGAGVIEPGQACISAGTWSINEIVTAEPTLDKALFMNPIYTKDLWLTLEGSATSASNLEWFVNQFCAEEKAEAKARGISVYEVCNEKVASIPPEQSTILFHPYLFGSDVQANARAGFYGVGGWHTRAHLLRAVYEGIVYTHLAHINRLRSAGIPIEMARFTGGGARSAVWTQMFADALQFPIEVPAGEEFGAKGAAMCAGIGVGVYMNYADAVEKCVRVVRRHEPDPVMKTHHAARYQEHQYLANIMQAAWDRLEKIK